MQNFVYSLTICLLTMRISFAAAQDASEVPISEPNDAIMANPAEMQTMHTWAGAAFLRSADDVKGAAIHPAVPFSFRYNGFDSAKFLETWTRTVAVKDKDAADRIQHEVVWTDPKTKLQVTAVITVFKRYPAVDWVLYFKNQGKQDTPIIENIQAVDAMLRTGAAAQLAKLHRIRGDYTDERSFLPTEVPIAASALPVLPPWEGRTSNTSLAMTSWRGKSSYAAFPFFNLECAGGGGVITAIGWSGQWAAKLDRAENGDTRLQAGMEKTHLLLHPGEQIRTPRILLMSWKGDRLAAQQRFRRLLMFHYLPRVNGRLPLMPIAVEAFERFRGSKPEFCSEASQLATIQFAHRIGCDAYWLDAGWHGDECKVDWQPDPKRFPNGLKPLSDACNKLGMRFILWFHPEIVNLGDPAMLRATIDTISQRLKDYDVDIYRHDFNIEPLDSWRAIDPPDRQGIAEIRSIEGLYTLWDELRQRKPGLLIDNCASGGKRIDLETCMRSVPLWRSDTGCYGSGIDDWKQNQVLGLGLYLPVFDTSTWSPNSYETRSGAAAGILGVFDSLDKNFPLEQAKKAFAEVRENRKYWYGDFYPLTRAVDGKDQWAAYQFHRSDLNAGLVYVFRRDDCSCPSFLATLHAIDPAANYIVEFIDDSWKKVQRTMTGRELAAEMELKLPMRGSQVIRYRSTSGRSTP